LGIVLTPSRGTPYFLLAILEILNTNSTVEAFIPHPKAADRLLAPVKDLFEIVRGPGIVQAFLLAAWRCDTLDKRTVAQKVAQVKKSKLIGIS
jgi:hypothetical protein